jgi:AraC-like DNA-binding protein
METEGAYQNADLSLRQLAERLSLTANKLSWLLNEHVGQNFNAYINAFRLKQFQRLALDPANSHLTLLGLAYESGFNSKTVFNAYCKKSTGMTPRAWVKKQQQA